MDYNCKGKGIYHKLADVKEFGMLSRAGFLNVKK
jgi:hypothetical protein